MLMSHMFQEAKNEETTKYNISGKKKPTNLKEGTINLKLVDRNSLAIFLLTVS